MGAPTGATPVRLTSRSTGVMPLVTRDRLRPPGRHPWRGRDGWRLNGSRCATGTGTRGTTDATSAAERQPYDGVRPGSRGGCVRACVTRCQPAEPLALLARVTLGTLDLAERPSVMPQPHARVRKKGEQ